MTAEADITASADEHRPVEGRAGRGKALRRYLGFRNASALWVFAAMFILFALWVPDTFLTSQTWRSLLDSNALVALAAIGITIVLAAGVFDLSIGTAVGVGAMLVAWGLSTRGWPVGTTIALTLLAGALIGLANGFLVVVIGIDSFIATLGVSSALGGLILAISGGQQIVGIDAGFQSIATTEILTIGLPVWIVLVIVLITWYVLEKTLVGRHVYATGGNRDAARLAGVNTGRIVVGSFVACSMIAALAGLLIVSRLGTGDPSTGPDFLLPTFSAAVLGATQFRNGRFNVFGTLLAVYVLAVGVKGLQLAGASFWVPSLFNGVALIVAVSLTLLRVRGTPRRAFWKRRSFAASD
ncbi:MAG: ribose transport system permease protein [Gaiellales bacterium]|nr:ribose transport system permease protein [Gaiellales bacterium]